MIKLLLLKHSIFQVDCDLLLPPDLIPIVVVLVRAAPECILVVESVDDGNATLGELAFHEQLTILATLGPQLHLSTVPAFEIVGQLGLAFVSVQGS